MGASTDSCKILGPPRPVRRRISSEFRPPFVQVVVVRTLQIAEQEAGFVSPRQIRFVVVYAARKLTLDLVRCGVVMPSGRRVHRAAWALQQLRVRLDVLLELLIQTG